MKYTPAKLRKMMIEAGHHPEFVRAWEVVCRLEGKIDGVAHDGTEWVLVVVPAAGGFAHANIASSIDERGAPDFLRRMVECWDAEDRAAQREEAGDERDEAVVQAEPGPVLATRPGPPAPVPAAAAGSFLYLFERPGLLKIGKSDKPTARARAVSYNCGQLVSVVSVVGYVDGASALAAERIAHLRFAGHRQPFGEWFADVPEIRAYFAGLAPP